MGASGLHDADACPDAQSYHCLGDPSDEAFRVPASRHGETHCPATAALPTPRARFDFGQPEPPEISARQQLARCHEPDLAAAAACQFEPVPGIEVAKLDGIEPAHQLSSASGIRV